MPTNTDLVKDLPADFDIFGQAVDDRIKALNPETTLGDIAYRSSTANTNTRLAIGTTGQVLTVSGGVPAWATPAGGGKVLQVVSATYSTETQNNTSTYADTGLTATITPTSATSTILVTVHQTGIKKNDSTSAKIRLMRGATQLIVLENEAAFLNTASTQSTVGGTGCTYLDSPATTSATTYKTQFLSVGNISYARVQQDNSSSTITLMEIGA